MLAVVEKMRADDVASCFNNPKELCKKLAAIKRSFLAEFSEVIVFDGGALIPREAKHEWAQGCEHGFAHPLQNPSERRSVFFTLNSYWMTSTMVLGQGLPLS